jgi:hypothetical protein
VATALSLLLVGGVGQAAAKRIVEYQGEVADGQGTSFSLFAEYRDRAPWGLVGFRSGDITLTCDAGTRTKRAHLHIPPEYRKIRHRDGYFSWRIGYVLVEPAASPARRGNTGGSEPFFRKDHVMGNIKRKRASGELWIRTFGHEKKGDCRSGRLDWTALRILAEQSERPGSESTSGAASVEKPRHVRSFSTGTGVAKITRR